MTVQRGTYVTPTAGGVGTTALQARLSQAGLIAPAGDLGVLPGVLSGLTVVGTTGWHYDVTAGHAVCTRGATDGVTLPTIDGTTSTATITAAPASGSRFDLIWIRQNDLDAGDADNLGVIGVTEGAASGSPSRPYGSVPAGALVLYEAEVHAGAASTGDPLVTLTRVAPRTALRGTPIPVYTKAERDALTPYDGLEVDRLDMHRIEKYNSGLSRWSAAPNLPHAEFTTAINGTASGTLYSNISIAAVPSYTTDPEFCTISGSTLILTDPGTYAVFAYFSIPAATTGRTLVQITGGPIVVQGNAIVGEAGVYASYPNLHTITAGVALSFSVMQTTGASRNLTGRIIVTRIA